MTCRSRGAGSRARPPRRRTPSSASSRPRRGGGQRDHRVRMRVVDVRAPGRTRAAASRSTAGADPAAGRSAGGTRPSSRRPSPSRSRSGRSSSSRRPAKPVGRDRRQIRARALDPEHAHLAAGVVRGRSPSQRCCRRRRSRARGRRRAGSSGRRALRGHRDRRRQGRPSGPREPGCRAAQRSPRSRAHLERRPGWRAAPRSARAPRPRPARTMVRTPLGRRKRGRPRAPPRATRARRAPSPGRAGCRPASPPPARRAPAGLPPRPSIGRAARSARRRRRCGARSATVPVTSRSRFDGHRVLQRDALEDAAGDGSWFLGRGLAAQAQKLGDTRRHVAGADEGLVVRVDQRAERAERRPRARRAPRTRGRGPPTAQLRRHSCSSQSPVTFRSRRKVPATPPSFVRFAAKVSSVISGSSTSRPDQRPRADAEEGRIGLSEWHGGDGRAGVVRGDGDHLRAFSGSSERCGGRYDLRKQAGRDAEALQQVVGPVARTRVEALRRRRIRELARPCPAEPVVKKVGDEQEPLGIVERPIGLQRHRGQLEDRVDRHQLDAGPLVELPRRDARVHTRDGFGPPRVSVVHRAMDQLPCRVDQPEVDGPGIDGDRVERGLSCCRAEAVRRLLEQALDVPAQGSVLLDRRVLEAVYLFDGQAAAVERTDGDAAALGAEVDRGHPRHQPT